MSPREWGLAGSVTTSVVPVSMYVRSGGATLCCRLRSRPGAVGMQFIATPRCAHERRSSPPLGLAGKGEDGGAFWIRRKQES